MSLPPNTYGVRCEFHPGGTPYTYLVDLLHHGEITLGDWVVIASPKGGFKVILVVERTDDLAPVDLKYMKYVVQKVNTDYYKVLMRNLTASDEIKTYPTSPLIDEGDTMNVGNPYGGSAARGDDNSDPSDVNEPGDPRGQNTP